MSITSKVITSLVITSLAVWVVQVALVMTATRREATAFSTVGKALMFSVMDDAFAELHSHRIEANAAYSLRYNYTFVHGVKQFGLTQEELDMPPTTYKVSAAWRLLAGRSLYQGPAVDWLAFFDADAAVQNNTVTLDDLVQAAHKAYFAVYKESEHWRPERVHRPDPCHFISQDYPWIVNSGFWLLRNSSWSLELLATWKRDLQTHGYEWVSEQGALQNTLLHVRLQSA